MVCLNGSMISMTHLSLIQPGSSLKVVVPKFLQGCREPCVCVGGGGEGGSDSVAEITILLPPRGFYTYLGLGVQHRLPEES